MTNIIATHATRGGALVSITTTGGAHTVSCTGCGHGGELRTSGNHGTQTQRTNADAWAKAHVRICLAPPRKAD